MLEKLIHFTQQKLAWLLFAIAALRIGYLFSNGLDLTGDESYYWDWSRRPDWCYFSKPPMVAWLIGFVTFLGGDYTAVVRLPAVLLGTLCLFAVYKTAKAYYSPQAGAFAVLLSLSMPFNMLANFVMTIDAPLACFWMLALYYLQAALFQKDKKAWLWAGVATGAAILSKQVALLLPLLVLVFLLLDKRRHGLLKREFLLYLLPVVLSLLPIILWNQAHDWVMFGHSSGHFGLKKTVSLSTRLGDSATFLLYQLLLASPVLFGLMLVLAFSKIRRFFQLNPEEQWLMLTGPVLLLGILLLSFVQKVQGNWPLPFYFSAVILLAGQWQAGHWHKPLKVGLFAGYIFVALTYALPFLIPIFNLQNTPLDVTRRLQDWEDLAKNVAIEQEKNHAENTLLIALGHRYLASQMAFYMPKHPQVLRYESGGKIASQYEVWGWPTDAIGKSAFIVSEKAELPPAVQAAFSRVNEVATVASPLNKTGSFHLFFGENLKILPSSNETSEE